MLYASIYVCDVRPVALCGGWRGRGWASPLFPCVCPPNSLVPPSRLSYWSCWASLLLQCVWSCRPADRPGLYPMLAHAASASSSAL
eukprot:scaffold14102_cov49-Tisochrysis_lutea.AAC.1